MSREAHPNVNAVGLVADAFESVQKHLRGKAKEEPEKALSTVSDIIARYAVEISIKLDATFGGKAPEKTQ